MTRDAYADRLLDLAYGELPKREAREVEVHAASCEACRAELARIRGTRRAMAALPDEPAPERGERILLAAAREAAELRKPRPLVPRWLLGVAVAASVAVVATVSYRVAELRPRRDDRTALLGDSPYAAAPPAAAEAAPPAPAADVAAPGSAPGGDLAHAPEPPRAGAPSRVAEAAPRRRSAVPAAPSPEREGRYASPPPASAAPAAEPAPARAAEVEAHARAERAPDAAPAEGPTAASAPPAVAAAPSRAPSRSAEAAPVEREAPSAARRKASAAPEARAEAGPSADAAMAPPAPRPEVRTFPGCEGEAVRRVETDAGGRVVRYVREGRIGGRRLRVEHAFAPDGRPAGVAVTDLDAPGAALDARALGLTLPARAEDAGIDAPPRCGR